jgi:hypothetical protein
MKTGRRGAATPVDPDEPRHPGSPVFRAKSASQFSSRALGGSARERFFGGRGRRGCARPVRADAVATLRARPTRSVASLHGLVLDAWPISSAKTTRVAQLGKGGRPERQHLGPARQDTAGRAGCGSNVTKLLQRTPCADPHAAHKMMAGGGWFTPHPRVGLWNALRLGAIAAGTGSRRPQIQSTPRLGASEMARRFAETADPVHAAARRVRGGAPVRGDRRSNRPAGNAPRLGAMEAGTGTRRPQTQSAARERAATRRDRGGNRVVGTVDPGGVQGTRRGAGSRRRSIHSGVWKALPPATFDATPG